MQSNTMKWIGVLATVAGATLLVTLGRGAPAGTRVLLCDGETSVETETLPQTREEGLAVAAKLMAGWRAKNPNQAWNMSGAEPPRVAPDDDEALLLKRFQLKPPFNNRPMLGEGQNEGHPYRDFSERDVVLWERETQRLVLEGAKVFHDAKRLGSTIAVSCDMCHPDASNTHPETYPKYQTQIGKTVLLRHMINWCIEHPLRGKPLAHDDERMIALEAYIFAQRTGKTLQYGRH